MNLAHRIQALRKQKGMSQEDLANEIGVSRQAVSKWESEQASPDLDKIILLSQFFNVSTDYLLMGLESPKSSMDISPMNILSILPAAINAFGLILTILLWTHYQTSLCYIPVFACNIAALVVYTAGLSVCAESEKKQARKAFWQINIWLMAVIPVLLLTDTSLLFLHHPLAFLMALVPYGLVCLSVSFLVK